MLKSKPSYISGIDLLVAGLLVKSFHQRCSRCGPKIKKGGCVPNKVPRGGQMFSVTWNLMVVGWRIPPRSIDSQAYLGDCSLLGESESCCS